MRFLLAALALFPAVAVAQGVPEPIPVVFLPGGAAVDGCYRQWQTNAAAYAFSAPTDVSRQIRTVDALRRVDANDYTESLTAVVQVGRARAPRALTISDAMRMVDGQSQAVRLDRGDEIELYAYAGEGIAYFGYQNAVWAGSVPGFSVDVGGSAGVEVTRQPVVEVWVRLVQHAEDRPAAWLNTAQAGIIERETFCGG